MFWEFQSSTEKSPSTILSQHSHYKQRLDMKSLLLIVLLVTFVVTNCLCLNLRQHTQREYTNTLADISYTSPFNPTHVRERQESATTLGASGLSGNPYLSRVNTLELKQKYDWVPPVKTTIKDQQNKNEQILVDQKKVLADREGELEEASKRAKSALDFLTALKDEIAKALKTRAEAEQKFVDSVTAQSQAQTAYYAAKDVEYQAAAKAQQQATLLDRDEQHAAINKASFKSEIAEFDKIYQLLGIENQATSETSV